MRRLIIASVVLALSLGPGGTLAAEEEPPATGTFGPAGSPAETRVGNTATLLPDGRVLVVGGMGRDDVLALAEVWDPATGTFDAAGSLVVARYGHTASSLPDGRVLVVGGQAWGASLASAEVWDPGTGSFRSTGSLVVARFGHTATTLPDGRVLVVGGDEDGGESAEVWDPATGEFVPTGDLSQGRGLHSATLLPDGRVLVVGGQESGSLDEIAVAEIWDPATGEFGPAGSLADARFYHTATALPDGRVLVVGGFGEDARGGPALFDSVEVWDPATTSFGPGMSLAEARFVHTASVLADGRVLVVGGFGESGSDEQGPIPLASAEAWDPATEWFGPAGSLREARVYHTGTALPDGRALVVGGFDEDEEFTSPEVWSPDTE